jgi:predicted PurR-regulated permease PerM
MAETNPAVTATIVTSADPTGPAAAAPPVLATVGGASFATASSSRVFRNTLAAAAAVGVAFMIWRLADFILLLFACALVGMMFYQGARWVETRTPRMHFMPALTFAVLVPLGTIIAIFTLFGSLMTDQFADLVKELPAAVARVEGYLRGNEFGRAILARAGGLVPDSATIVNFFSTSLGYVGSALSGLAVIIIAGIYLAAQPRLYARGILNLVPAESRSNVVHVISSCVDSLNAWLKAQGIGMLFVGITTSIALTVIGVPSGAALGLVGGLCEFVPYLGVIVVTIPALILGFAEGTTTGIWTAVALATIQFVQGNFVLPMVQSRFADLPPALTIFALIAAGVLLGPLGVILAVPMTVVGLVLVRELVTNKPPHPTSS